MVLQNVSELNVLGKNVSFTSIYELANASEFMFATLRQFGSDQIEYS